MAQIINNIFPIDLNRRKAVGFSLPFNGNAVFKPTYTTQSQIKSNLINYFLTNTGERFLNYNFGANLRSTLFEHITSDNIDFLKVKVQEDISTTFPNVKIESLEVETNQDKNMFRVILKYSIINFGIEDSLELILQ